MRDSSSVSHDVEPPDSTRQNPERHAAEASAAETENRLAHVGKGRALLTNAWQRRLPYLSLVAFPVAVLACSLVIDPDRQALLAEATSGSGDGQPSSGAGAGAGAGGSGDSGGTVSGDVCADDEACDDGSPCTVDSCGDEQMCVYRGLDADQDNYTAASVGTVACRNGTDCNESMEDENGDGQPDGPQVNPGAAELCDGLDNDCDGETDRSCSGSTCLRCIGDLVTRPLVVEVEPRQGTTLEGSFTYTKADYARCDRDDKSKDIVYQLNLIKDDEQRVEAFVCVYGTLDAKHSVAQSADPETWPQASTAQCAINGNNGIAFEATSDAPIYILLTQAEAASAAEEPPADYAFNVAQIESLNAACPPD